MTDMLKSTGWEIKNRERRDSKEWVQPTRGEDGMIEMVVVKIINRGVELRIVGTLLVKAWRSITREVGMSRGALMISITLQTIKGEKGRTRYLLNP
jgi:hypothetical protein